MDNAHITFTPTSFASSKSSTPVFDAKSKNKQSSFNLNNLLLLKICDGMVFTTVSKSHKKLSTSFICTAEHPIILAHAKSENFRAQTVTFAPRARKYPDKTFAILP